MNKLTLRSDLFLIVAALIWGLAFVAQQVGGKYVPPFYFGAIRFALGSLSLVPLLIFNGYKEQKSKESTHITWLATLPGSLIAGVVLFFGVTLQQMGMTGPGASTAGKAGFITDLYIVLVPLFGLFFHHRLRIITWISVAIAVVGLYFISVSGDLSVARGDAIILCGSFFWTFHILIIDHFSKKVDVLKLSFIQFVFCSVVSFIAALLFEQVTLVQIQSAALPLLYGGLCSVGVAYTFQTLGQRHTTPAASAIILSLESVFSCLGGAILLGENLGLRVYFGCLLMISGMILSQLHLINFKEIKNKWAKNAVENEEA